jgi:hypothetical protein
VAAARPPALSSGRPRPLPAARAIFRPPAPSSGRPRHSPPIRAVSPLTIVSYATCTAVVTLRLAKSASRHCKFTPDVAMLRTLRRRDGARTQVRSPSRMGQLWPNKIRHGLLSARPEFPYNNHAAHGRYGQILLTEDLSREHDRQGREWRGLIALSAVIPGRVRQANDAYAVASRLSRPDQGSSGTTCSRVPPVGVEPTLGTLLGGRPLPLGYGGWVIIPRSV